MSVWLLFWTIGGFFAICTIFWQLFGKEINRVSYENILTKRDIFGFGITKNYSSESINSLRVSNVIIKRSAGDYMGMLGGLIAFGYGAKTILVGNGIDEAEATIILHEIIIKYP